MSRRVIDARKRFWQRRAQRPLIDPEILARICAGPPALPKQPLTKKLALELLSTESMWNLFAAFADQHYAEFLAFVAEQHPELAREWVRKMFEKKPQLREWLTEAPK